MKHRIRFVHNMLRASEDQIFPQTEGAVPSDVFRADGEQKR
jgi:hypothetical protein